MIGRIVNHKVFGEGRITEFANGKINVVFANKETTFRYPAAFDQFLKTTDAEFEAKIEADRIAEKEAAEAKAKAAREAKEREAAEKAAKAKAAKPAGKNSSRAKKPAKKAVKKIYTVPVDPEKYDLMKREWKAGHIATFAVAKDMLPGDMVLLYAESAGGVCGYGFCISHPFTAAGSKNVTDVENVFADIRVDRAGFEEPLINAGACGGFIKDPATVQAIGEEFHQDILKAIKYDDEETVNERANRLTFLSGENPPAFPTVAEALNYCFGTNYKMWQRAVWHPVSKSFRVWFPHLAETKNGSPVPATSGCLNMLSEDGDTLIFKYVNEAKPAAEKPAEKNGQPCPTIVFAKEPKGGNYVFKGVFVMDMKESRYKYDVHKRIAKSVTLVGYPVESILTEE